MDFLVTNEFLKFRNGLVDSLNKYDVPYKIFGGAVICLLNPERKTEDLDIMLKATDEAIEKLCQALDCVGFDSYSNLKEQINDGPNAGYKLYPKCEEWEGFHIDLLFDISVFNYDNISARQIEDRGVIINAVECNDIIKMKNRVNPVPDGRGGIRYELREKDKEDIKFLSHKYNLDPVTGDINNICCTNLDRGDGND